MYRVKPYLYRFPLTVKSGWPKKRNAVGKVYADAHDGYRLAVLPNHKSGCHTVPKPYVVRGIDVGTV